MRKQELLNSIKTYREIFNSIEENVELSDNDIMHKYFSFEETRSSSDGIIRDETLIVRNKMNFEELPPELLHFYKSLK